MQRKTYPTGEMHYYMFIIFRVRPGKQSDKFTKFITDKMSFLNFMNFCVNVGTVFCYVEKKTCINPIQNQNSNRKI